MVELPVLSLMVTEAEPLKLSEVGEKVGVATVVCV
jgi:hypothetical protein